MPIKLYIRREPSQFRGAIPTFTLATRPFRCECVDPLAWSIIIDSLDSSIENSGARLRSIEKTFPQLSLYAEQYLSVINGIRESFNQVPKCDNTILEEEIRQKLPGAGAALISPAAPRKETVTTKVTLASTISPVDIQKLAEETARTSGVSAEEVRKALESALTIEKIAKASGRKPPKLRMEIKKGNPWGPATLYDAEGAVVATYESPNQMAEKMGIARGKDFQDTFERTGKYLVEQKRGEYFKVYPRAVVVPTEAEAFAKAVRIPPTTVKVRKGKKGEEVFLEEAAAAALELKTREAYESPGGKPIDRWWNEMTAGQRTAFVKEHKHPDYVIPLPWDKIDVSTRKGIVLSTML